MAPPMQSPSEEYRGLVDKAYNKFARLREFPPYGRNKWDFYFHKAFQVYSKLWKFQQENRQKLVEMGLKRWEIGEIASRIGQLYYNYYLRTSDAKFLTESFIFYEAILSREYFKEHDKDVALSNKQLRYNARFIVICLLLNRRETVHLLVRQLRALVEDYGRTFQQGTDAKEWKLVVQEIARFMKADAACETSRPLRYCILYDPHPSILCTIGELEGKRALRLEDAVLASYYHNEPLLAYPGCDLQFERTDSAIHLLLYELKMGEVTLPDMQRTGNSVKFSELTLDTFRMLQALEWEPSGSLFKARSIEASKGSGSSSRNGSMDEIPDPSLPPNPHKYILYRPTVQHLLLVLATACEELSADAIALLYISASGKPSRSHSSSASTQHLSAVPSSRKEIVSLTPTLSLKNITFNRPESELKPVGEVEKVDENEVTTASTSGGSPKGEANTLFRSPPAEPSGSYPPGLWLGSKRNAGYNFLYPSDILPFTRRPLFIIIDSDNSSIFESICGEERGEPAVLLLSPSIQPVEEKSTGSSSSTSPSGISGSMFTFFLTAPLLAFCRVVKISRTNMPKGNYDQTEKLLATLITEWGNTLSSSEVSPIWARVLGDPFLRQLIFRFIFCRACYGLHLEYQDRPEYSPRCCPPLPDEVLPSSKVVESVVFFLASSLGVADQFDFKPAAGKKPDTTSSSATKDDTDAASEEYVTKEDSEEEIISNESS